MPRVVPEADEGACGEMRCCDVMRRLLHFQAVRARAIIKARASSFENFCRLSYVLQSWAHFQ